MTEVLGILEKIPAVGSTDDLQLILDGHPILLSPSASGTCVRRERNAKAATVVTAKLQDFLDGAVGRANFLRLFNDAAIHVEGDFQLAVKLVQALAQLATSTGSAPRRYPSVRRPSEKIASGQTRLAQVDRVSQLSVAEFQNSYLPQGRPVVITNAVQHWKLFSASWDELKELLRDAQGFTRHGDYASTAFTEKDFRQTSIGDYMDKLLANDATLSPANGFPPYLGNNFWPADKKGWFEFPPYFAEYSEEAPKLWIGPGGTVSPFHRDKTDNLFVQVKGRKSVLLGSPDQWQELYAWSIDPTGQFEGCDVDPEKPDLERFPLFARAHLLRVSLEPGDMLFIPEGWYHHVRSLETQLSMNFWTLTYRSS
jgi:hypothetical protein